MKIGNILSIGTLVVCVILIIKSRKKVYLLEENTKISKKG